MLNAVIIHEIDSVVISTEEIEKNSLVVFKNRDDEDIEFKTIDNVPIYHKISRKDISKNSKVYKYGECIGKATQNIKKGAHVHTHNLKSLGDDSDE
jgi:altronate dehydratase small subunit